MLTPAYSTTATERVLPRLALDFTTASLDNRVSFARALNTATRVNSNGYIETINADLPRFDYSPTSVGTCRGLLIEESRTNLALFSEQFNDASWTKVSASVTANAETAPDNTLTADKIIVSNGLSTGNVLQIPTLAINTAYTWSVFAKKGEWDWVALELRGVSGDFLWGWFNLNTGTLGTIQAGATATITNFGNGWFRCTFTRTTGATASSARIRIYPTNADNAFSTGDGTSGIFAWGAQLEAGAFATSYIPTTTTSLMRNADVVSMTGTNFSDWWVATMGGAVVQYVPSTVSGTRPVIQFDDNTADNIIALRGNTTNPELYIKATTDQAQIDAGTIAANTNYGLSGAWNTNDCAAAINGGSAVTDTSVVIPTVTQARLGSDGANYLNGRLQTVRYWPQRITNAETQAFSKL